MANQKGNYRSIFKATAILGVVQLFNIIIGIARNKVAALLLGPSGIGIIGLLTSATSTVSGFTNCGVSASVVKNISLAYEKDDRDELGKVLYVFRRLMCLTGMIGLILTICLCDVLSNWLFGNSSYAVSIAYLSVSLLLIQMSDGYITILKGCRRINYYAKANVLGNLLSLLITIPLYCFLNVNAIVPVLIISNICTLFFAYLFHNKLQLQYVKPAKKEFTYIAKDITKTGIAIAFSNVFPVMAAFIIRSAISAKGGIIDVGYFSAGFAILNGYVGMVFTAMSSDYIPRLSGIVDDNIECKDTINNQLQLSFLILLPFLSTLIIFSYLVVNILYSKDFYPMVGMVVWGALGMLFKTLSWCYGVLLIPKRDNRPYLVFSILSAVTYLILSVVLYYLWGIVGLGIAFMLSNGLDFIPAFIFIYRKYHIPVKPEVWLLFVASTVILISLICINYFINDKFLMYSLQSLILLGTIIYSFYMLNKLMDLKSFIKSKIKSKF